MGPAKIEAIPDEGQQGRSWALEVDGNPCAQVGKLRLSSRFAVFEYGLTPSGHDGCCWREHGGGGVVVLPWTMPTRQLLIGVVRQYRPFQGGSVLNAPRGFVDRGEPRRSAARRELIEATGYDPADRVAELGGDPANPNSALFDTCAPGGGVRFFGVEIDPAEIVSIQGRWTLHVDRGPQDPDESVETLEFVPWTAAARLGDMFTNAAVARLLAFLHTDPAQLSC